jgi:hypothetical protein
VTVTREAIFMEREAVVSVKDGKADPDAKRDGPDGFFIDPLFKAGKKVARAAKDREKRGGAHFLGQVALRLHAATSYRLLAEVLYTLNQAEFKSYQILTRRASGATGAIPIETPRLSNDYHLRDRASVPLRLAGPWALPGADGRTAPAPVEVRRALLTEILDRADLGDATDWSPKVLVEALLRQGTDAGQTGDATGLGTPVARAGAGQARAAPAPPPFSLPCDEGARDLPTEPRSVGVRFRVDAAGAVTHLATAGSTPVLDDLCGAEWLRRKLDPRTVPAGDYGIRLVMGGAPGAAAPGLPGASALTPIEQVIDSVTGGAATRAAFDFTVVMTAQGFYLKSRRKPECTARPGERLCILAKHPGTFDAGTMTALSRAAHGVHQRLAASPRLAPERFFVTVIPEPAVTVADVIRALDAVRELPGKDPRRRCRVPIEKRARDGSWHHAVRSALGHRMGYDDQPGAAALPWEQDCMFYSITLALGSG